VHAIASPTRERLQLLLLINRGERDAKLCTAKKRGETQEGTRQVPLPVGPTQARLRKKKGQQEGALFLQITRALLRAVLIKGLEAGSPKKRSTSCPVGQNAVHEIFIPACTNNKEQRSCTKVGGKLHPPISLTMGLY
jgi:hypothetical protein